MSIPAQASCLQLARLIGLEAAAEGSNFVFSPLSIRAALSLAAAGASGETRGQLLSFLGAQSMADLDMASARLLGVVRSIEDDGDGGSALSFASSVWVDRLLDLKPGFEEAATSVYGAVAKAVDFKYQALEVTNEVNAWVDRVTKGCIKNLLPDGSVDHLTRLVLANALYFKGLWQNKFDRSKTRDANFYLLDGSVIQASFMTTKDKQFISSFDGFKVLRLPYCRSEAARSFSMLIFLPDDRHSLNTLIEDAISDPYFIGHHIPEKRVDVGKCMIPKFKISFGFEASRALTDLGLHLPFSGKADFTEMVLGLSPTQRLYISSIHQKATIEVEEEGTVATAATAIGFRLLCYSPPVDFVADHAFMFAIMEDVTREVLFSGHIVNPLLVD